MSIETLSFTESIIKKKEKLQQSTNYAYYEALKEKEKAQNTKIEKKTEEEEMQETFAKMKVANHLIDRLLDDYEQDKLEEKAKNSSVPIDTTPKKKAIVCTKCKGSEYYDQGDLRKHFKTEWHNFNAKLSAQVIFLLLNIYMYIYIYVFNFFFSFYKVFLFFLFYLF